MPNHPPDWTDAELRLRGQLAANTSWANTIDRTARTEPGRQAMLRKFEVEIDPAGVLTPAERAKRAENLRKAHMQRLALKSAKSRRLRKQAREAGVDGLAS